DANFTSNFPDMRLVHYRPREVVDEHRNLAGMQKFDAFLRIYDHRLMPVDRSEAIRFPVCTKSLFPLPKICEFTKSYEEVCNGRALEVLARAERLDTSLYVFWSGGVDSTCVLVSLLKNATRAQKERIVVLLSEGSITEYPLFYHDHIRGRVRRDSA